MCFLSRLFFNLSVGDIGQKKTRSLRFYVVSCNSYSLACSKAENEQCWFKLIQHWKNLYSQRHCRRVSGWVISGPFVSWYFLMQILKALVQSTCDGDHPVVKINVKLLEILKIWYVVVSWLVLVCLGNASVMLYFQQMLNKAHSVCSASGGDSSPKSLLVRDSKTLCCLLWWSGYGPLPALFPSYQTEGCIYSGD